MQDINAGYTWTVDIDLAKYFDTINHDKLIGLLSNDIKDGRVISLIRKYLQSGVMINGVVMGIEEGAPQCGPLSTLLSNIMLLEPDVELTKRKLCFCRYADDCNVYVKSKKDKSTVDRPWKLKFLEFSFYRDRGEYRIRVHEKSLNKFKLKLKKLTSRNNAMNMEYRFLKLKQVIVGWINYFSIDNMRNILKTLDKWLRQRIRMCFWKQWKKTKTKHDNLVKLEISNNKAWEYANTRKGYWRISNGPILSKALTNKYIKEIGLISISEIYSLVH